MSRLVCADYETVEMLADGTTVASTEAYRDGFRISSMATTERIDGALISNFYQGEETCKDALTALQGVPLLSFNYQFECLVSMCRFPQLQLNWQYDAMRLCQNYDNSGKDNDFVYIPLDPELPDDDPDQETKKVSLTGFGLAKCVQRILQLPDHKQEAYTWLVVNGVCRKGQEGAHLHALPHDILKRYNCADTENTLLLYEFCVNEFARIGYDWTVDHRLYMSSCRRLAAAKRRGIVCDRDKLTATATACRRDMAAIEKTFLDAMAVPIKKVERDLLRKRIKKFKKLKGAKKYLRKGAANKDWSKNLFNAGSTTQLENLFVKQLGVTPFFYTPKNKPSFKSAHLHSYGDGGLLLTERKKQQIVASQAEALLEKSEHDGIYHVDLKACGTRTGRFSGAGGVNIQALARRREDLMGALVARPGHCFVSQDASAGEPTVLTQLTKDLYYRYFCFDGVGKEPYYKDGILMIDDIYLGYASVCPMFRDELRQVFTARPFAQQWLKDPEICKGWLKKLRKNAKWVTLALGYGLGPKGMYNKAVEAGLKVTPAICREAYYAYWDLFTDIKQYCKDLEKRTEELGWLQNIFGYRFIPTELRKSFNGEVQSTISGLFNWYCDLLEIEAPYAHLVTVIHDEAIYELPTERVEDFRGAQQRVIDAMNEQLQWDIKLRFGFAVGQNMFEAK